MYSWWWVELSPETCRVKPLRRINAIVASCWIYFTTIGSVWDRVVEKLKTHILCSMTFFLKSYRLWDSVEKCGTAGQATDGNILERMRFSCWITKAAAIQNTDCFSATTVITRTRLTISLYVLCLSCFCVLLLAPSRQMLGSGLHEDKIVFAVHFACSTLCSQMYWQHRRVESQRTETWWMLWAEGYLSNFFRLQFV